MKLARGDFSSKRIEHYAEIIADSDTWITPTLTTSRKLLAIFADLEAELARSEMCYLHPMAKGMWSYLIENRYLKIPQEIQQAIRLGFEAFQRPFTKVLHDKGVKLMTGTDVLIPLNIPGYSIHEELHELVDVGLTPFEALKAATTYPMEYLGRLGEAGTIEVGKQSNFVLLDVNPLDDIDNIKKVAGVLFRESWLNRQEIQKRLDNFYW